jgi:hypothetical protein
MYDDNDNGAVENPIDWQIKLSKKVARMLGHIHVLKEFDQGRLSARNSIFKMRLTQAQTCVREEAALLLAEAADYEGHYIISLVTFLADVKNHITGWSETLDHAVRHVKTKVGASEAEALKQFK